MEWTPLRLVVLAAFALIAVVALSGRRGPRRAWTLARAALLLSACAMMLVPFVWLLCAAFKSDATMQTSPFLPPVSTWSDGGLTLVQFERLFMPQEAPGGALSFWRYLLNSIFLASASTVSQLVLCSLAGYALARHRFRGQGAVLSFLLATMVIPGMMMMAPSYALHHRIGWLDTWWCLLVPGAVSAFGIVLFRQAMLRLSDELIEAARLDGCGEVRIWWSIVMPLVRPMTAAFCLMTFLSSWNAFLGPQIMLSSQHLSPLPVVLSQYLDVYRNEYGVFLAGTLIAIIPPAVLFVLLEREFVAGLTSGAVKG